MYKAILFDLDGTLTDSGEGIMKSVQYALEKLGKPEDDLEKLRVFVGPPLMEEFMEYAGVDEEAARQGVTYYRERYAPIGVFENKVYPGIKDMLVQLKKKGYLLGVASSKPEYFVKQVLEHFELDVYQVILVGDREYDVLGAREAGLDCLAVSYGYGSVEELTKAGPLKIAGSAEEVLDFFE